MITTFSLHIRISNSHFFVNNMVGRGSLCLELVKMMHERRMAYKLRPFYSISVISGRWDADNERLCAMEPSYWSERFSDLRLLEQQARAIPTGLRGSQKFMKPMPIQVQI